jgi:integrase
MEVKIEVYRDKLRLVIPVKYYPLRYWYLGYPDQPQYYPLAYQIKRAIELDIVNNSFDESLEKYQLKNPYSILTIWEQYCLFKCKFLQPSSIKNLTTVTNHLYRIPLEILLNPASLKLYLVNNLSAEQARRVLMQIKASAKWALEMGFVDSNPYKSIRGLPRIRRKVIDPFSKHERELILNGFDRSEYYSYYKPFVHFLFLTGCRPSEAIALKWKNVDHNFVLFKEAIVDNEYKDCTKTMVDRRFPVNAQLRELLNNIEQNQQRLFNSKQGGIIRLNNFTRRAWGTVLDENLVRYRPPKTCRQTFITEMLRQKRDVVTIANWVGNTPDDDRKLGR